MKPTQAVLQARLRTFAEHLRTGLCSADPEALDPASVSAEQQGAASAVSRSVDAAAEEPEDPQAIRSQMNAWMAVLDEAGVAIADPLTTVRVFEAIDRLEGDKEEDNL